MNGVKTTFTSTHDIDLHGCGESIAAASDNSPAENVKPFAFCSHICGACTPVPLAVSFGGSSAGPWFEIAQSVVDANEEVLTEKSYFLCVTGANAKVEFEDPGQDCIRIGEQKPIITLLGELQALNEELSQMTLPPHIMNLTDEFARQQAIEQEILSRVPYNQVQFTSSHNSYDTNDHSIDIREQFLNHGTHSFELDIHKGDPPRNNPDIRIPDDFYVYHDFRDPDTRYKSFSEGMNEIASLGNTHPVTVFVDLKDELNENGDHTSATFDQILENTVGRENLYTPQDLIEKAQAVDSSISTLAEAVAEVGMPTIDELNGKTIVVATDNIGSYTGNHAFVAGKPHMNEEGEITDENMVFFNIGKPEKETTIYNPFPVTVSIPFTQKDGYDTEQEEMLQAIEAHGYVSRGYYFNDENFLTGKEYGLNHITTNEIGNEWNDLSAYGFPFRIKGEFLEKDFKNTQEQEGKLAVVTGATLTCPKAVMGSDIKFFRMNK